MDDRVCFGRDVGGSGANGAEDGRSKDRRVGSNLPTRIWVENGPRFEGAELAHVESTLKMEFLLNLVWTVLAVLMVCAWLRLGSRTDADRRMQFVALAVLLLILFPVVSVTDDLQAVQNPAETDRCERRSHLDAPTHPTFAAGAALPSAEFSGLRFYTRRMTIPSVRSRRVAARPEFAPVTNRPPPAA